HIGLTHAFLIWIFGAFSTAFVLFFPADHAMVYLLYRDGRLGRFVWITGTLVVFVPATLGLLGLIPYAPIYEGTPYEVRLSPEGFWIGCFVLVAISGQILLVMGQVKRAQERMADSARQLAASADHLTRLQSEATLGREVSKVAHELRTPLSAVRSILESSIEDLKRSGGKMTPEEIEDLAVALREQSRSLELVAALRNIARSVREEKVDLNRVVGDSLRVLKALETPGRMVVDAVLYPEPLYFQGSHAEMMQVILNLARNAVDASLAGARVRLSTSRDGSGKVLLRCEDEGSGIPAEIREKIFEPLFTTKEVGKGTGLGLSTSRDLVTRRGGALVLESTLPGKGSVFRVELPGVN
ncbi:MAG: HAMP domain-containing sensor histidine kinase, partial [Bdellovibrionota bacterium]